MQTITIKNKNTNDIIFKGIYNSDKECIEDAVSKGINLDSADLRHKNLQCANIDTAQLNGADLRFSNLNNANISESNLAGADIRGASLIGTCLAESDLTNTMMQDALFGATDIAYARLDGAQFSTLSALHLPLKDATSMQLCAFQTIQGHEIIFSTPPILIQGLFNKCVYLIDNTILFGHDKLTLSVQDVLSRKGIILSMLEQKTRKI
jgi:hypothetical protein